MVDLSWPSDLGAGTAVWQYFRMAADDWDADRDPQLKSANETIVEFTPDLTQVVRYEGEMGKASIEPMVSRGIINAQGKLCTMLEDGSPGPVGVILPATDSETITPRDWTYRATITQNRVRVREFSFPAPADKEVDLADYVEVDPSGGTHIVTEVETAERAESAASDAERFRNTTKQYLDTTKGYRDETLKARDQTINNSVEADDSVGKRVFVGGAMVSGETGWRDIAASVMSGWQVRANGLLISRSGNSVTAQIDVSRTEDGTSFANIFQAPVGFDPIGNTRLSPVYISFEMQGWFDNISGPIRVRDFPDRLTAGDRITTSITWITDDPWPSSLPGAPA